MDNKSNNDKVPVSDNKVNDTSEKINVKIQNQSGQSSGSNNPPAQNTNISGQTNTEPIQKTKLEYTYDAKTPFSIYFISVGGADNQGDSILIKKET